MNSNLNRVWLWCGLSLLVLLGLRYLPEMSVRGHQLRRVDLLSDVINRSPEGRDAPGNDRKKPSGDWGISTDSSPAVVDDVDSVIEDEFAHGENGDGTESQSGMTRPDRIEVVFSDDGLRLPITTVPVEDYGVNGPEMERFYNSLRRLPDAERSVHIAVFGDSFIEGDLITDYFRDTLQSVFGGGGVGFVPIASPMNYSRTTIMERSEGFSYYSAVDTLSRGRQFAISGQLSVPTAEANQITYHGIRQDESLRWFTGVTLLYESGRDAAFSYRADGEASRQVRLPGGRGLQAYTISLDSAGRVRFSFPRDSSLVLHGLNFESEKGLYVDNFSLRGTSGHALFRTPTALFQQSDSLLHYRLVIVQYGLNVLSYGQTDYSYYAATLRKIISRLRAGFPESSILVLGVGDRSERLEGDYRTMRGLYNLLDLQRRVAREEGVAFWDLHTAMGGDGSMVRFVEHRPPLANKDYTHINRRGGNIIAGQLAKALLEKYGDAR